MRGKPFSVFVSISLVLLAAIPAAAESAKEEAAPAPAPVARDEPPSPRPALKTPKKGAWPFAAWSYAKAYTYNFFEDSPVPSMVVDGEGAWSPHIRSEQVITEAQAETAAKLVGEIRGTFETTKCTFPRHAVVLFDQSDKPVAAANVCFECEGILVWPDYDRRETEDEEFDQAAYLRLEKAFLTTLGKWKALFGTELGLPTDWKAAR